MISAVCMFIYRLRLTVNGKLDVKALPAVDLAASAPTIAAPEEGTALERDIAGIWRDVLHIPNPGLEQNFFDVGGNSIHVADVHSRLQKLLDRRFSITELFAHSTIRALAAHFTTATDADGAAEANRLRARRQREAG